MHLSPEFKTRSLIIFFHPSFTLNMQSNTNSQVSSHYREHTRQQDGRTVLAPGPEQLLGPAVMGGVEEPRLKTHGQSTVKKNERAPPHQNPYIVLKTAVSI
jgi:hypothetical protein